MKIPARPLLLAALAVAALACGPRKVPPSVKLAETPAAPAAEAAVPAPAEPAAAPEPAAPEVATVPESSGAVGKGEPLEPFVKTADLSSDAALATALAGLKGGRPTDALIAQLKAARPAARLALIQAMWHEEVNVRAQAPSLFTEAGIAGDAEILKAFQRTLRKEPDRDARGMAAKALVRLNVPGIAPVLIQLLQKDGEGQVRANAAYALGAHDEHSATDALVAAIPVARIGVPEDIWVAVKFVLECDYFNARTIDVDGGLTM